MNSRLNFYGLPGAGISSDWIRPRIANRFQLKKKVIFGVILRRILAYNITRKTNLYNKLFKSILFLMLSTCIVSEPLVLKWEHPACFDQVSMGLCGWTVVKERLVKILEETSFALRTMTSKYQYSLVFFTNTHYQYLTICKYILLHNFTWWRKCKFYK